MTRPRRRTLLLWSILALLLGGGFLARHVVPGDGVLRAGIPVSAAPAAWTAQAESEQQSTDPSAATPGAAAAADSLAEATSEGGVTPGPDGGSAAASEGEQGASDGAGGIRGASTQALDTPLLVRFRSLLGVLALAFLAWLLSTNRKKVPWRVVLWGLALQLIFALFILKTPVGIAIFDGANRVVTALLAYTIDGAYFIFGELVYNNIPVGTGEPGPGGFEPIPGRVARTGSFFAFNVLPTIIFFSSLMTVLYHMGVMQWVVKGVAWVMQRTMRTSGAETTSAAGNIFVGQTEAPLLIKPFVERMTLSELNAVMTAGFATVAGGVLAAYVGLLVAYFPDIAGHLMAASVMSAPAALVVAKLMLPEEEEPETAGESALSVERPDVNAIDAAARGASEGLHLALNVGAMLLAFLAILAMLNGMLGWAGGLVGFEQLSLEWMLGWLLAPLAWIMGVPWVDAATVGSLMGLKTVANEFFAYIELAGILESGGLQPRSVVIAAYALSGFANFSSIAIQIGGIGGIAPSRRHDLSRLGLRAMIGGSFAAFMTASIAGMLL